MLIEFRVSNHRSLRDEQVLSMEAATTAPADFWQREIPGYAKKLLPVAALYGANASGKSNVLSAVALMWDAVVRSQASWDPAGGVPQDPYAWGNHQRQDSLLEVVFVSEGVRYQYGFTFTSERFIEEWLYAWPHGKKQTWLERDSDEFRFGSNLTGENQVIKKLTRPNSLFLSAAAQLAHPRLSDIYIWFSGIESSDLITTQEHSPTARNNRAWLGRSPRMAEFLLADILRDKRRGANHRDFLNFVAAADLGIEDVRIDHSGPFPQIRVKHKTGQGDAWLMIEQESGGTQKLFRIAPVIMSTLQNGGVLIADELESNLHPALAVRIIRLFNDPATNPRNAQLIFTTHDTNLLGTTLGEPALLRDEVWLTEKDEEGATKLYPLTNYKPRKAENLERGYLQGRYGAIPFLSPLAPIEEAHGSAT